MESARRLSDDRPQLRGAAQRLRAPDRPGQTGQEETRLKALRRLAPLAAGLVVLLLPFVLVDVPPVLDYPNHLARWFLLAHPDDPILSRLYAPHWHVTPNLGFDPLAMLLLRALPVHVGGRLVLALALLFPALGVLAYARAAFGRVTGWSLTSALAAFNGVFFLGFLNFLLATGLALMAAALWLVLRRQGRTAMALGMGAAASVLLFFCHLLGVLFFGLLVAAQELEGPALRRDGARLFARAGLAAAALLPALFLYGISPLSRGAAAVGGWDGLHRLWEIFTPFMTYDRPVTLMTGALVLGLLAFHVRRADYAPGARTAIMVLACAYVLVPDRIEGGTFVSPRLALMTGLLLFAGVRPRFDRRLARTAALACGALMVVRSASVALAWHDYRREIADLRAAIAPIPPGARVLLARGDAPPRRETLLPGVYRLDKHLPALLVIERRAFWPFLFADPAQQTVIVRPAFAALAQPLGEPPPVGVLRRPPAPALLAALPYLRDWWRRYDYLLVMGGSAAGRVPLHADGRAALYRLGGR